MPDPVRTPAPLTVLLTVWGVPARAVPQAVLRMASGRIPLRHTDGLRFAKLLGTGRGRTFGIRDADPRHWAVLTVWDDAAGAGRFLAEHPVAASWRRIADEELAVTMRPIACRGRWSGRAPFGEPAPQRPSDASGPVASITRARIRPARAATFWRAVPPVADDLSRVPGLRLAIGIGEAPVGLQGTFSLWDDASALTGFAHRRAAHQEAVRRTGTEQWYAEELFARFAVLDVAGGLGAAALTSRGVP